MDLEKENNSEKSEIVEALKGIQLILETLVIIIIFNFDYNRTKDDFYYYLAGLIIVMYLYFTIKKRR